MASVTMKSHKVKTDLLITALFNTYSLDMNSVGPWENFQLALETSAQ